ncbi:carbohydrate ABC transporter permease [Aquincola sp. S2]|uniref:Carbohydrate ABC transporter permease n=1 Tax=Pseudaquabacterium terrae TaxID=2732868 RepID=A0ABX2ES39_9BURK|nr:carbohydrate ABC transporter permease [Aquabacterium terrae]NRF71567.1 carbohydrate ABC transporter permease [Aquabacterium terrae]
MRTERWLGSALTTLTWVLVALTLSPIGWMLWASLKSGSELSGGASEPGAALRWRNYVEIWTQVDFGAFLLNSLVICGVATLIATGCALCAAYALARLRFRGSDGVSVAITLTQVVPGMLFFLPLYMLYRALGERWGLPMLDTRHGLVFLYVALFTPASIWIMRGFFVGIPRELEDAAVIDGCSRFGALWRIVLPLCGPGIIATATFVFLLAWDELFFAWVLTSSTSVQPLPVGIRLFVSQFHQRLDLLMAAGIVSTLPMLLVFFAGQRWFIKGLTAGAVKG